jgi:hypothetical protein
MKAFFFALALLTGSLAHAQLSIAVKPGNALIGPGPAASCLDYAAKAAGGELDRSVRGPVIVYNSFSLQWESNDILYITQMKATAEGSGISGGRMTLPIAFPEIEALLDVPSATIVGPTTIISNHPSRKVRCSLALGPIYVNHNSQTFEADVTIEIAGYSENANGEQKPVSASTKVKATYYAQ